MVATYPVPPLLEGHPLAIGVTSYDGRVFYGLTADRDAFPDADLLGTCVTEALDELLATTTATRAPRGRSATKSAKSAKAAKAAKTPRPARAPRTTRSTQPPRDDA